MDLTTPIGGILLELLQILLLKYKKIVFCFVQSSMKIRFIDQMYGLAYILFV